MFQGLVSTATRLFGTFQRSFHRNRLIPAELPPLPALPRSYECLERVVLSEEVSRTLFQEYAAHRASDRGEEEIGWVLLGVRETEHAVVLATLPAGTRRSAGVAHVEFNSTAQAVACRIVRQWDKRLTMLGVVHTHPGSLRHPSDGDFQGDSQWVGRLRGREGIFGIGTADRTGDDVESVSIPLRNSEQIHDALRLSWYALGESDSQYRRLVVELNKGPDLALPLREIWTTIEAFAGPLERLGVQQAGMLFEIAPGQYGSALVVRLKLAEPGASLRIVLEGQEAAFYWQQGQELFSVAAPTGMLDRSVYLMLAELAGRS